MVSSLLFSFQIYCDFSGYSDIAIGTARLFGITLTENFKSPYLSASINETVINSSEELGRLTDAGGGEQSTRIEKLRCIMNAGLANRMIYNGGV